MPHAKIFENTAENVQFIQSLPKIYLIACWADFGVREYAYDGECDESGVPLVYDYDDANGTRDVWIKRPITNTTTGWIYAWTTSKARAEEIVEALQYANERV